MEKRCSLCGGPITGLAVQYCEQRELPLACYKCQQKYHLYIWKDDDSLFASGEGVPEPAVEQVAATPERLAEHYLGMLRNIREHPDMAEGILRYIAQNMRQDRDRMHPEDVARVRQEFRTMMHLMGIAKVVEEDGRFVVVRAGHSC